jgi:hypothetical protein
MLVPAIISGSIGAAYLAAPAPLGLGISGRPPPYPTTHDHPPYHEKEIPEGIDPEVSVADIALDIDVPGQGSRTTRYVMAAYDDIYSLEYFRRPVRPYWRRNRATAEDLLTQAAANFAALENAASATTRNHRRPHPGGGPKSRISTRVSTLAAHKLVADFDGTPLHFSKENFSNGCIGTVDGSIPLRLCSSSRTRSWWRRNSAPSWITRAPAAGSSHAPHDLGQFPGQVYGGGEL